MKGYLRARGAGRWQLAVYTGRDGRGRPQYRYETVVGTRADAQLRLDQIVAGVTTGRLARPTKGTLAALADQWWELHAPELSPTTRRGYRRLLEVRIKPALGTKRVDRLGPEDLERYYRQLAVGDAPGGGKLGPRSIRQIHAILSGMLSSAVRWRWILDNPATHARVPRVAARELALDDVDADALDRIIAAAGARDGELGVYLRLAVATGARRGELCALRWSDFDLERAHVRIARSIASDDVDSKALVEKDTKSHQARTLALDAGTLEILRELRRHQLNRAIGVGVIRGPATYLFAVDVAGAQPWHPDRATGAFRRAAKKAGVKLRLHDLRHYHGSTLADAGVALQAVRDRLGHRDIATTNLYLHGRRATDQAAADLIGNVLDHRRERDAR